MFLRNGLQPWHLLIVAIVVALLVGSRKLPDAARALGRSLRVLKGETKARTQTHARRVVDSASGSGPTRTSRRPEATGSGGAGRAAAQGLTSS
jgi:sec-independent protein translocase protein TatA